MEQAPAKPRRNRIWIAVAAAAVVAAVILLLVLRSRTVVPVVELLRRLPREDRVIASFDVATLRKAGVLQKALGAAKPEQDYQQFVQSTGFDYLRDLQLLLVAYGNQEAYLFVRGAFDVRRLRRYAESNGGSCSGSVCRVKGSTPEVTIGFASIDPQTLAVTSSNNANAIEALLTPQKGPLPIEAQPEPIWMLLPPAVLKENLLPPRMAMFVTAALECSDVYLGLGARNASPREGFEARLRARCQSASQAAQAVRELDAATTMLRRVLAGEQKDAELHDLAAILTHGEFRAQDNRVMGTWPIEPAFVESLGK